MAKKEAGCAKENGFAETLKGEKAGYRSSSDGGPW
jgi:hypothetical protein